MTPKNRLVATIAATATALAIMTASAAPAHADKRSDRMLMVLLGIGTIAAIANSANKDDKPAAPQPAPQVREPGYWPHAQRHDRGEDRRPHKLRPRHNQVTVLPTRLPGVCVMQISGLRGETRGYGERCLTAQGVNDRLPQHCAHRTVVRGHNDRIYAENCMAGAGFQIAR